jgi:hypothetical protein
MRRLALCSLLAFATALGLPAAASAAFGFESFHVAAEKANAAPVTQAGSHPHRVEVDLDLNTAGGASDGDLRDLTVHLPPGLLVNPTALNECSNTAFHTHRSSPFEASLSGESCPNSTQVGVIAVNRGGETRYFGLFDLVAPFGEAAALGASPWGTPLIFATRLREPDSGLDLSLEGVPQSFDLQSIRLTIWGTPWEGAAPPGPPGHNPQRGNCLNEETAGSWGECLVNVAAPAPPEQIHSFLTMPTTPCDQPLGFSAAAGSWQGARAQASAATATLAGICHSSLEIAQLQLRTAEAAAATGLLFNLGVNDGGGILNPGGEALPAIERATVALPEGLTINPSLGAGLKACSEAQWAEETATSPAGAGCPAGSKIGDTTLEGTLGLPPTENLTGSVFLATPTANPFHTLLALYILVKLPRRGLIVKSEGKIEPDPETGRLLATFEDLPRLLYTHFTLSLREGQRAALLSPPACGRYPTGFALADYAHPAELRSEQSAFFITGNCPAGGTLPFAPGLIAGSLSPTPAAYTPFYLRMTRSDQEQEITDYAASFPPGLLAKIAGVSECPEAAIEAAKGRSGAEEEANPSCPANSSIGHTMAGYGVGGTLAWAPGGLYLAGPWHGDPLSVVAIDSAKIGPFDLGTVVVRTAVRIETRNAQASIDPDGSDPIPHIIAGIPIHVRDIRIYIDRPDFTLNPTSCDPMAVSSTLTGAGSNPFAAGDETSATSSQRYQLLGCGALGFKPRLTLALRGGTRRSSHPSFRAEVRPRAGQANISAASVKLPPSLFLAQEHLRKICTRAQFAAGQGGGAECPKSSVYGHARAFTPLLEDPLEGDAYIRSSDHPVPDLIVTLQGHGLTVVLEGRIDSVKGGLRGSFEDLPDAPLEKFVMTLPGGRHGLLSVSEDLCGHRRRANSRWVAQDNATAVLAPKLNVKCAKHKHKRKHRKHHHRGKSR